MLQVERPWAANSTFSIHRQSRAGDGTRGVGGEEKNYLGDSGRIDPLRKVSVRLRRAILRRVDGAGHDAVDVDVRRLHFVSQGLTQAEDSAFRCAVGRVAGTAGQTIPAGHIDNLSAALAEHLRYDGPAAKQGRAQIHVEEKIPVR